jgi:hypothetical protein
VLVRRKTRGRRPTLPLIVSVKETDCQVGMVVSG